MWPLSDVQEGTDDLFRGRLAIDGRGAAPLAAPDLWRMSPLYNAIESGDNEP